MVMGNLCVHKGERVRQLAENAGFELIYLPPYSLDLNPHRKGPLEGQESPSPGGEARNWEALVLSALPQPPSPSVANRIRTQRNAFFITVM